MADLLRVSINGQMPGGEKWSVNPVYKPVAPLATTADEAAAMATAIAAVAVPAFLLQLNVAAVTVTGARVEAREASGALEAVGEATKGTPTPGTSSTPHPFQTSMVLSLRTTSAGARGKGRLYWPATGVVIQPTTLRINSSNVSDFLSGMNGYLAAIRTAIRGVGGWNTAVLGVWSRADATVRIVTDIRAGDIADTQRRRRDALAEGYSSAAIIPPSL